MSSLTKEAVGPRKYTPEQKDQFFVVFDRLKSTRDAARELGFNEATCAGWVRKGRVEELRETGGAASPGTG